MKFTVDLPVEVHETPDDEARIAIDSVPVLPGEVGVATLSIALTPDLILTQGDHRDTGAIEAADADIPPLPEPVVPMSRHGRRYSDPSEDFVYQPYLPSRPGKPVAPEGFWPELVFGVSFTLVNLGDSRRVRARKKLDARIARPFDAPRFVPVISPQGGVGATTITTLLGMALAEVREDRVLAVDAHPDRGTLADRVSEDAPHSVRDVVEQPRAIRSADDMANIVVRDGTGLDILASDRGSSRPDAFDGGAYNVVADVAEKFYSVVLTDGASGVREPVMQAALQRADAVVIVTGGSAAEARLASEAVDALISRDDDMAARAIVAINTATPGTSIEDLPQIEAHFRSKVRDVIRIPYDEELVAGSPVRFGALRPFTRDSARELAALVMDGIPETPSMNEADHAA